jgi:hypothetical protein
MVAVAQLVTVALNVKRLPKRVAQPPARDTLGG